MNNERIFGSDDEEKAFWGDQDIISKARIERIGNEENPKIVNPTFYYNYSKFIGQLVFILLSIILVLGLIAAIKWLVIYIMGAL